MKTGLIYKIELTENDIYIGSTTKKLCMRQAHHNYDLKKKPHQKLYKSCIENNITVIKCVWVADVTFNSIAELRMVEETYRKELNGNLNMVKCYTSEEDKKKNMKEYCENNKEYIKDKNKEYRENNKHKKIEYCENNKEYIKEQDKKYREKNKEIIKIKKNEYYENNKNKINEKNKKYYEENKNKINEKIKCDKCGCMSSKSNIKQHQRTNKCKLRYECIFSDSDSD